MCQFYVLILLQFSTNKIHNISYHRQQTSRLLTNSDIGVNGVGIPHKSAAPFRAQLNTYTSRTAALFRAPAQLL